MKKNLYTLGLILLFTANGYAQSLVLNTKSSKVKWTGEEITTKQHYGSLAFKSGRVVLDCLLYTSPSPRDRQKSRMPSSA